METKDTVKMVVEAKDTGKVVVVRPVPSRPSVYLRSLERLLAVAADDTYARSSFHDTGVAIRPKSERLGSPPPHYRPTETIPSYGSLTEEFAAYDSMSSLQLGILEPSGIPYAFEVCQQENMGISEIEHEGMSVEESTTRFELPDQPNGHIDACPTLCAHQSSFPMVGPSSCATMDAVGVGGVPPSSYNRRPSFDGYKWRKYGQKKVKESKLPRSYYKCTHRTCPVAKTVDISVGGEIAGITYKGEHNHPKPHPSKLLVDAKQCASGASVKDGGGPPQGELSAKMDEFVDRLGNEVGSGTKDAQVSKTSFKRSKIKAEVGGGADAIQGVTNPISAALAAIESHAALDGYHWRKYGGKAVKCNTYPRSYYKCTNLNCNARKRVDKVSDDPDSFVTKYEGEHNHDGAAAARNGGSGPTS